MKTLGPKYGKLLNAIRSWLETCDTAAVVAAVRGGGTYHTPRFRRRGRRT